MKMVESGAGGISDVFLENIKFPKIRDIFRICD